jgi:hypothetical protein
MRFIIRYEQSKITSLFLKWEILKEKNLYLYKFIHIMIKTPTVFVLGPGASIPYGYPSGEKLREEICHELEDPSHPYGRMLQSQGFSEKEILEFSSSLSSRRL